MTPPHPAHLSESQVRTASSVIMAAVAIAFALLWLKAVMVPFVIALFLGLIGGGVIDFMVLRLRIPHTIAVIVTVVTGFLIFASVGGVVSVSVAQFANNAEKYQSHVQDLLDKVMAYEMWQATDATRGKHFDIASLIPENLVANLVDNLASTIAGLVSSGILVTLFVFFILLKRPVRRETIGGVAGQIERGVKRYLATKFFVSATTGVLVYAILEILNVRFAITFGAFAFLLNFIPNLGSILATFLPVPEILFSDTLTPIGMVLAFALPGMVQFTIGNLIEPKLMGDTLDMHPVVVLFSLIFWGVLWGVAGMFLAVPLTACIKIVLQRIEFTRPVADLLAGRFDALSED
ncbi:MAG: AI-2E family transporter [Candidatus Hydrogenedens sp.]|nr:AI-2E family transporter [Candidatus Hydrogenedens sp.]